MITPPNRNRDPRQRGFQENGAPTGYGQQNGASAFLDRSQQPPSPTHMPPEDGRLLASAPGQFRPQGPLDPPPYMQALQGAAAPAASTEGSWQQAIDRPAPQRQAPSVSATAASQPYLAPTTGPLVVDRPAAAPPATAAASTGKAQIAPVGNLHGSMQGFSHDNFVDPNMDSVKYAHARLANGITRPSEMAKLVASEAYQKRFPGATFDGKDRINFNGALSDGARGGIAVYNSDVLRAANKDTDSSEGGWWNDLDNESGAAAGMSPQGDPDERRRLQMALASQGPAAGAPQAINIQDIIAQLQAEQRQPQAI